MTSPFLVPGACHMVGADPKTVETFRELRAFAGTRQPILVLGETGTGKEVVAREIHAQSRRRDAALVAVNCAELDPAVAVSELFGHEKGAFTGAVASRKGLFREAEGGTLFLDEIGELAPHVQAQLLRAAQERTVRPFGADRAIPVDTRIVAATNRDVKREIEEGRFRPDLLNRFPSIIRLAPLRERPGDIDPLVSYFVELHTGQEGMNQAARGVSDAARRLLREHPWPDNVRGLEHAVVRALIATEPTKCAELDVAAFALAEPQQQPDRAAAAAAVVALAENILDALIRGEMDPARIPAIARQYGEVALDRQLVNVFLRRFRGVEAEVQARRLFNYSGAESVRRLARAPAAESGDDSDE